jgi:hypothetical protein
VFRPASFPGAFWLARSPGCNPGCEDPLKNRLLLFLALLLGVIAIAWVLYGKAFFEDFLDWFKEIFGYVSFHRR